MPQGSTTINFGAFPGSTDTSVTITGQTSIGSSSLIEAWLMPIATADHSADEHMLEPIKVFAGNKIDGTGFTIYGWYVGPVSEPLVAPSPARFRSAATSVYGGIEPSIGGTALRLYGEFTVGWVWN